MCSFKAQTVNLELVSRFYDETDNVILNFFILLYS